LVKPVKELMQTYSVEAAKANFISLLHRAARGEEVLITEKEKPIAKLGPPTVTESYRERVRALRGSAPGIDTTVDRDEEDRV
jgi:antitoxin (DNA-binding transcriptional repressor) of toxin-antitoxin stability system